MFEVYVHDMEAIDPKTGQLGSYMQDVDTDVAPFVGMDINGMIVTVILGMDEENRTASVGIVYPEIQD